MKSSDALLAAVTLEVSLKPFSSTEPEAIRETCRYLCQNWERLVENANEVRILLWVGDGNEIFEWRGNLDDELIWASYIGFCNYAAPEVYDQTNRHYKINQAVPYMDDPPPLTFRHLRLIIQELRVAARDIFAKEILIGATIDPGPEFAPCRFKVDLHPEVLTPNCHQKQPAMMNFMTHQAVLNEDRTVYAGFPDGIPARTSLGTFIGAQFSALSRDLSFDYIWFSNGFGYSHFPWGYQGEVFDGEYFDTKEATSENEKCVQFWQDFRDRCPDLPVQVRGTNFTIGMDIAADGCSHREIYRAGKIERPPVNPPWGSRALGLEMASYLSRLADTPSTHLPFRFYLNDPWFIANPWYDMYCREPYDLYVPLAASRLRPDGAVDTPTEVALLTVDTQKGELLRDEANEVTPHILRAMRERADAAGPVVWVYPYAEYHDQLESGVGDLAQPFMHDWFVARAISAGLPVNTVCSTDAFCTLAEAKNLPDAIYLMPAPADEWRYGKHILEHVQSGGNVLLYGALQKCRPELLAALGISLADKGLAGDFSIDVRLTQDRFTRSPLPPLAADPTHAAVGMPDALQAQDAGAKTKRCFTHRALNGGGELFAVMDVDDPALRILLRQKNETRAYAVSRARSTWHGGRLAWIRGSLHFDPAKKTLEPRFRQAWQEVLCDDFSRRLLADFGWDILHEREEEGTRTPNLFIKRHRNAFYFIGHKPDTTARFWVKTPYGAPVYAESDTPIRDGYAGEVFSKAINSEVRVFVRMADGTIQCKELATPIGRERHLCVSGLTNATVTIFPERKALTSGSLDLHAIIADSETISHSVDATRGMVTVENYSDALYITW